MLREGFFVPCSNLLRSGGAVRDFDGSRIEDAVNRGAGEEKFRGGDVAKELVSGHGAGVGLIAEPIGGDRFENFFCGAAFIFDEAEENVVEQEVGLFGSDIRHCEFSPYMNAADD